MIPILATIVCTLLPLDAATHPLVGTWKVTYPWHVDIVGGVARPVMEEGVLAVEIHGDSLIATLESSARSRRLASATDTGAVVFVMRDVVTVNMQGTERQVTAVGTWTLNPSGDRLSGSLERRLDIAGAPTPGPQPLAGRRVRR